jgi:hypothetical protein
MGQIPKNDYEPELRQVATPDIVRRYALVLQVLRRAKQRMKAALAPAEQSGLVLEVVGDAVGA